MVKTSILFLQQSCYLGRLLVKSFNELVLAAHALQAGLGTSRTTSASYCSTRSALKMLMKKIKLSWPSVLHGSIQAGTEPKGEACKPHNT